MKKKLNTESIANELEGASLFFTKSASPLPGHEIPATQKFLNSTPDSPILKKEDLVNNQAQIEQNQNQKRSDERTVERSNERLFKPKREKIRHTFDIYKDQLMSLQIIQLEKVQAGKKKPKLGKMVSEGIDLFLKQAASKKKQA